MDMYDLPILTTTEERYLTRVQRKIEYCSYCQPYDEGDVVWIYGDRYSIEELLETCKVPEKSWENIMPHLSCPYCGSNAFEIGSDVGLKTKIEKDIETHLEIVKRKYGKEVKILEDHLEKYPLLAYQNKFARRIFKEIKEKKLPIVKIKGNFYRARKVESSEVILANKMSHPPQGKSTEGRFNHAGQSHLYLSNEKEAAIKEVISDEPALLVWCQEFQIETSVNNILDLSFDWDYLTPSTSALLLSLKLTNSIGRSDRNKDFWRPDYYLTSYIMDCAKQLGYNGIKYNSTKDYIAFDLVLFHPDKIAIKPIGNPIIEIFRPVELSEDDIFGKIDF